MLQPNRVERAIERALEHLGDDGGAGRQRDRLVRQVERLDRELVNLSETAARSGAVPAVLDALARREEERQRLVSQLAAMGVVRRPAL